MLFQSVGGSSSSVIDINSLNMKRIITSENTNEELDYGTTYIFFIPMIDNEYKKRIIKI